MRLDVAHESGVALAATFSYVVVMLGGELSPLTWICVGAPWLSLALRLRGRSAPLFSGTLLALTSLGLAAATLAQRGSEAAVLAAAYALVGILAARLLTRSARDHDLQALVISLLLVVAGSVLNVGVSYGLLFVPYALTVVWALTTRQLLSSAERSLEGQSEAHLQVMRARHDVVTPAFFAAVAGVALAVLLATGTVFLAFPRIGIGNLGFLSSQRGRFPTAVSLRGEPRAAAGGNEVLVRVQGVSREAFERGLYLRGAVYDAIDEYGFSQLEPPPQIRPSRLRLAAAPEDAEYVVSMSPLAGRRLFTLGEVSTWAPLAGGKANPSHQLGIAGRNGRGELEAVGVVEANYRYALRGGVAGPGHVPPVASDVPAASDVPVALDVPVAARVPALDLTTDAPLFALPASLDPRIQSLADEVAREARTPEERARALRGFLLREFQYTLSQPNAAEPVPMRAFLLEDRRGHCEYFASAYALLLRTQGIAARVIGGYQGGAWDEASGGVVFQGKNAHAWVEWFLEGRGWIVEDPTPLATAPRMELRGVWAWLERLRRAWDDRVVDFSLADQQQAWRRLQRELVPEGGNDTARPRLVFAVLFVAICAGGVAWWRRSTRERAHGTRAPPLARALLDVAARARGSLPPAAATLREAIAAIPPSRLAPEQARVLDQALRAYEAHAFGERPLAPEDERAWLRRLRTLRASLGAPGAAGEDA